MKCNNCGNDIFPGATFCTKCGSKIILEEPVTNTFFNQEQVNSQKVNNLLEENREHAFFDGGYNAPIYKRNNGDKSGIAATIVGIIICVLIVGIAIFLAYKVLTKDNDKIKNNEITCTEKNKYVDSSITIYFKNNEVSKVSGKLSVVNKKDTSDMNQDEITSLTYHSFLYLSLMYLDKNSGADVTHKEEEKISKLTYEIDKSKANDKSYFEDYDGMTKDDVISEYKENGYTCK